MGTSARTARAEDGEVVSRMGDESLVLVERHGARGELVLNRPEKRNALTGPLVELLIAGLDDLTADESVNVILLLGAGGTFCAGRDRSAFAADPPPVWRAHFGELTAELHGRMYACPKLIVGALERAAIAAGSALALGCDLLVAGDNVRFHVAEVGMGMAAPINVAWLELKYGAARALEFAAGGQAFNGPELVARGLAVTSVPDERVVEEARAYADILARNQPEAVAIVKRTIRGLLGVDDFRERIRRAQALARAG